MHPSIRHQDTKPASPSRLESSGTSSSPGLLDMSDLDRSLVMPPSDEYSDAVNMSRSEPSSSKQIKASCYHNDKDIAPALTVTTTKRSQGFLTSTTDSQQGRVGQRSPLRRFPFPAEILFEILDYCPDGTAALAINYNPDNPHERRCPFMCAIVNGNERLLKVLIEAKYFSMDRYFQRIKCSRYIKSPLNWAIERPDFRQQKFIRPIKRLLEIGFCPTAYDEWGQTPLHKIMRQRSSGARESRMWHIPIINMLIQHGADVNCPIQWGTLWGTAHTPLMVARSCNQEQSIIDVLLHYGARAS
ncbi:hypothetical protein BZA77DRAFT_387805 [Pyronema omphalodes]|nr:hypothetical protein BZA77DRAFT_387805 [Pyronema omphalodes]